MGIPALIAGVTNAAFLSDLLLDASCYSDDSKILSMISVWIDN